MASEKAPYEDLFKVADRLKEFIGVEIFGKNAEISTASVFPSGETIRLLVRLRRNGLVRIGDGASALRQMRVAGVLSHRPGVYLAEAARWRGLDYGEGEIFADARPDDVDGIAARAMLVSSAAVEAVVRAVEAHRSAKLRTFKLQFGEFMSDKFGGKFQPKEIEGKHKKHAFNYVYARQSFFVVDPVTPDLMSINQAFTVHSDLRQLGNDAIRQVLVFEPEDKWDGHDSAILQSIPGVELISYRDAQKSVPQYVEDFERAN